MYTLLDPKELNNDLENTKRYFISKLYVFKRWTDMGVEDMFSNWMHSRYRLLYYEIMNTSEVARVQFRAPESILYPA